MGLTRQGVSKHLRVLEHAGMVACKRVGRESRYVYQPSGIAEAVNYLERASKQWDQVLARLKASVESG
jgi:predicted transcriptional regulator